MCSGLLGVAMNVEGSGSEDRWPQFRGIGSLGTSEDPNLPESWSTTDNVAWVSDVPGLGWSSPIVWDDTVVVTSVVSSQGVESPEAGLYGGGERPAPTDEHQWVVFAFEVDTGSVRWSRVVHEGVPGSARHLKNTFASETPVTDGKHIYAYFGNVGLFCLDMEGNVLWTRQFAATETRFGWGTASSPVLYEGRIYLVVDNDEQSYVLALSGETGAEIWRVGRDEGTNWSTPFVWKNVLRTELITTGSDKVRSYDLDGNLLWELTGMSSITVPTPFAAFGLLYLGSGYVGDQNRPVVVVKPGAEGDISIVDGGTPSEFIAWHDPQLAPYNPSPLVYGEYYYTLLDRGFFRSNDARTGRQVYGRQRLQVGAAFTASPWAYNGRIFALSEAGDTFVIRAGGEFEILGVNSLDEFSMATPAIANSSLFIRTMSKLYRIQELD